MSKQEQAGEWLGTQLERTDDGKTEQEEIRGQRFIAVLAVLLSIAMLGACIGVVAAL